MFCPKCHAEYRPGFRVCSDCQVDLVEALPQEQPVAPLPDVELVTVFKTADPGEVTLIRSLLEDAGIEYIMSNEATHSLIPVSPFMIDVQVREEDSEAASQLLAPLADDQEGQDP